jgi:hypothetical protein
METIEGMALAVMEQPSRSDVRAEPPALPVSVAPAVRIQADSDERVMQLWLHEKSSRTQRAYLADATAFMRFVRTPGRTQYPSLSAESLTWYP